MTKDASRIVFICRLYLMIYVFIPALAQTSTVNGRAEYEGISVATNPNGIPTLIYDCAKLPAGCSNVNQRNNVQVIPPGEPVQYGKLQARDNLELSFDTDQKSKDHPTQKSKKGVTQQNPALSPPFPILEVGLEYILGQIGANATVNGKASQHEESSPRALNLDTAATHNKNNRFSSLVKRQEAPLQCGSGQPCADGSCCNSVCFSFPEY